MGEPPAGPLRALGRLDVADVTIAVGAKESWVLGKGKPTAVLPAVGKIDEGVRPGIAFSDYFDGVVVVVVVVVVCIVVVVVVVVVVVCIVAGREKGGSNGPATSVAGAAVGAWDHALDRPSQFCVIAIAVVIVVDDNHEVLVFGRIGCVGRSVNVPNKNLLLVVGSRGRRRFIRFGEVDGPLPRSRSFGGSASHPALDIFVAGTKEDGE